MRKVHLLALASAFALLSARFDAAPVPVLGYGGGPIVSNPQVVMVEYGATPAWSYDPTLTTTMLYFLSALITNPSSYLGLLAEYSTVGITGARYATSDQVIRPGLFLG